MEDKINVGARIDVVKLDTDRNETWRYIGTVVSVSADSLVIEAYFDREDTQFHGICLCKGDRFIETYFTEKWFNIFEIHDRENGAKKGWYCNITKPATIEGNTLSYIDLGLDLLVYTDGKYKVLDWDDFEALDLSPTERAQALDALDELVAWFRSQEIIKEESQLRDPFQDNTD